jgi:predicted AAA+ superfamily ATPase
MIARDLGPILLEWATQYPVVTLTGPRQSGKTTLVKSLFSGHHYISLEDPDQRAFAREDPRGFLARVNDGAILDEIQNVPELASYLQSAVDSRSDPGRFILTGSRQFELMESVSQSLAGRTAIGRLLPFSVRELYGATPAVDLPPLDVMLQTGFFPRIHDRKLRPSEALSFYLSTYLERDVRQLLRVSDLGLFERFLRLAAGRTGQLLNSSALGSEVGVSHNTIRQWLSILETSHLIKLLAPWSANLGKRLVRTPKLYFLDTGLAAALWGVTEPSQLASHPLRGALFETFVIGEALKARFNRGETDNLFFYRDHAGHEVDLLMEYGDGIDLIEIKSARTIHAEFLTGMEYFHSRVRPARRRLLVHGGDDAPHTRSGALVVPWHLAGSQFH